MVKLSKAQHKTIIQFTKFGIIGAIGFVIDFLLLTFAIHILSLNPYWGALFSFPFAVTFTWAGNRHFTFREANRSSVGKQWARFAIVCTIGLIFNRGTYALLVHFIPLVYSYPIIGLFGGTAVSMFFNFFVSRKHVFR